jgi:hypothetical protein
MYLNQDSIDSSEEHIGFVESYVQEALNLNLSLLLLILRPALRKGG